MRPTNLCSCNYYNNPIKKFKNPSAQAKGLALFFRSPKKIFISSHCPFNNGKMKLCDQDVKRLSNFKPSMGKEESVVKKFPRMDVVCFQVCSVFEKNTFVFNHIY
jgi:hypothetical protein